VDRRPVAAVSSHALKMVLDNASDGTSDEFSDRAPVSDSDPYSSAESAKSFMIEASKFPQPMPIFGPLFGYNAAFSQKVVQGRIQAAAKILQRLPTEDEANALAYWSMKQLSWASYGSPLGVAAGAWRAYNSAGTFRFPFFQPNLESFTGLVWPSNKSALLTGARAVTTWHATRLLAYGLVGSFVGQVLFTSYAMSVALVGQTADPRLKDYVQAIRKSAANAQGRLPNQSRKPETVENTDEQDDNAEWNDNSISTISTRRPVGNVISRGSTGEASAPQMEQIPSRPLRPRKYNAEPVHTSEQIQDLYENFDDAPPTSARGMVDKRAISGSVWDRIRQQSSTTSAGSRVSSWPSEQEQQSSHPAQNTRRRGRDTSREEKRNSQGDRQGASSTGDSFSFAKVEEDRQVAKEEAQKEFDARVEQERRGGEFSTDSGSQKRW
jgi:hypothetical protein